MTVPSGTQVCVVGGGPAGVIGAYLLARKGIDVVLLEGEPDFNRDFRGDTLHSSSLEILDQLGHADAILDLCTSKVAQLRMESGGMTLNIADFSRLASRFPFVGIIPQSRFLEYMVSQAESLPGFTILRSARVHGLIRHDGRTSGVRYEYEGREHELFAMLTVGADGRGSTVRRLADIKLEKSSPPMDVLWFTQPVPDSLQGVDAVNVKIGNATMLVQIDRGDYLQLGFVIIKGSYKELREKGIDHFHQEVTGLMPELSGTIKTITDWKQIAILSVVTGRVSQWYRDGLLLIGDAAHVMSPVGGVGINYAIQDAVAMANCLAKPVRENALTIEDLKLVQVRREWPTRFIQTLQGMIQTQIINNALKSRGAFKPPLPLKMLSKAPFLQRRFAHLLSYGLRHETITD